MSARWFYASVLALLLSACGGGSGSVDAPPAANDPPASGGSPDPAPSPSPSPAPTPAPQPPSSGDGNGSDGDSGGDASSPDPTPEPTPPSTGGDDIGSDPTSPGFEVDPTARFDGPTDIAMDNAGNLYVMDSGNRVVRKISPSGEVSSLNGNYPAFTEIAIDDDAGYVFFSSHGHIYKLEMSEHMEQDNPTQIATLSGNRVRATFPSIGFSTDGAGNLYVLQPGERETYHGFRITPDGATEKIFEGGAVINHNAFAVDQQGNLAIAMHVVSGENELLSIPNSQLPFLELPPKSMSFPFPNSGDVDDMVFDGAGNLYAADTYLDKSTNRNGETVYSLREIEISRIAPDKTITRLWKGMPHAGSGDYPGQLFNSDVAVSQDGTIYFTDPSSHAVYKIGASGEAVLVAGKPGEAGDSN